MFEKYDIKNKLHKLVKTGFFSIFISNVFSKVIVFLGGIIIVRILSKEDYGIYSYIVNCIAMLCILEDFGASNATMQLLNEENDNLTRKKAFLKYGIKMGLLASLISVILIMLSPWFYPFTIEEARKLTPILFLMPVLTTIYSFINAVLRSNLKNTRFAIVQIVATVAHYVYIIPLILVFGVFGGIISQYFTYATILIIGIIVSYKYFIIKGKEENLSKSEKSGFLKLALATQFNNAIDKLLIILDVFLIGLLISNSEQIANYKTATIIPQAIGFLPACVAMYIVPYFVRNNKNYKWIKKNYNRLIRYGMAFYGIITLMLFMFAKFIVTIVFGTQYIESVTIFRILIIGFFFSATYKIPTSNILYTMRKVRFNIIITTISGIVKLIFNILFINKFGIIGAAITTTGVMILNSIISRIYFMKSIKEGVKNEKNSS